jgi:regulator of protease activity HflC (stomatin/prohibitin superfamily)
LSAWTNNG